MTEKKNRYVVDETTEFIDEEIDLDTAGHRWPDGTPMTEANTEAYTVARAAGRPSLGDRGSSPQVAFRLPAELRDSAERIAAREGRTVSAIAREALETYISTH